MKLYIKDRFGQTPIELLNRVDISLKAKGLFGYLQAKPNGWEFSEYRICMQLKEGKKSLHSAIKELETYGYLAREAVKDKEGKWSGYNYYLFQKPYDPKRVKREKGQTEKGVTLSKKESSKKETVKKKHSMGEDYSKTFLEFYDDYPKKKGKALASKAWNKLTEKDKAAAKGALPKHKLLKQWKKDRQFIPEPASWLNARRWEDELDSKDVEIPWRR